MSKKTTTPLLVFANITKNASLVGKDFNCTDCTDCACSVAEVSTTNRTTSLSNILVKSPISHAIELDTEFTLHYGPYHQPVVLNQAACNFLAQFEQPTSLKTIGILPSKEIEIAFQKLCEANLIQPLEYVLFLQQKSEIISAWIHITDRCNLRCTYCYLPHIRHDMDFDTGKDIIDNIFIRLILQKHKFVQLKYAGGEPLLKFPLIQQLHMNMP